MLSNNTKYGYKRFSKLNNENEYVALGCECINDGRYVFPNLEKKRCSHSTMINDQVLIGFVENLVSTEPQYEKLHKYKQSIQKAIGMYNLLFKYVDACNEWLVR